MGITIKEITPSSSGSPMMGNGGIIPQMPHPTAPQMQNQGVQIHEVIPSNEGGAPGGGPQISGKWFNPDTGDVVFVRDSIINGDEMQLITDKGTMSMTEFSRYIQMSDETQGSPAVQVTPKMSVQQAIATSNVGTNGGLQADTDIFESPEQLEADKKIQFQHNNLGTIPNMQPSSAVVETNEDKAYKMIDKIFKKRNVDVKLKITIDSDNFPVNELNMLKDCFDITDNEISEYITKNFLTTETITQSIKEYISRYAVRI